MRTLGMVCVVLNTVFGALNILLLGVVTGTWWHVVIGASLWLFAVAILADALDGKENRSEGR